MSKSKRWYETLFTDLRPFFDQLTPKQTNAQVRYIIKLLGLKKGMTFLDCPCGIGRISIPLAQKGVKVTGVDITKSYLDELKEKITRRKLKIDLLHADMRRISYRSQFDAAGNIWTSFGYFKRDSENVLVLRKIFQALKPGGKFLLHVINRDWIITYFESRGWMEMGGVITFESRKFDYATSTNRCHWRFLKDGKITEHHVDLRMFSYHELLAMFRKVGFVDIQGTGTEKDGPIDRNSQMMWIVGTKPKRR